MGMHESIGGLLVVSSVILLFVHYLKVRRERHRPTLRHALVASHLTSLLHRSG
jgi:hypothetical protein